MNLGLLILLFVLIGKATAYGFYDHHRMMSVFASSEKPSVSTTTPISNASNVPLRANASTAKPMHNQTSVFPLNNSSLIHHSNSTEQFNATHFSSCSANSSDCLSIRFIGNSDDLINCSYWQSNSTLNCQSSFRTISCEDAFNMSALTNYSFTAYGYESSSHPINDMYTLSLVKYQLYPFKHIMSNETTADNNTMVFDYVVPVYGFEVKIDLVNGQLVSTNTMKVCQISCFNHLVLMLNEAKFYDQMMQLSRLTPSDLTDEFRFYSK
jgi:hypothetical protein